MYMIGMRVCVKRDNEKEHESSSCVRLQQEGTSNCEQASQIKKCEDGGVFVESYGSYFLSKLHPLPLPKVAASRDCGMCAWIVTRELSPARDPAKLTD